MSMDKAVPGESRWTTLKRIFRFAAPYKKKFYWSVFLAIFLAAIAPVRPLLIQISINSGLNESTAEYQQRIERIDSRQVFNGAGKLFN